MMQQIRSKCSEYVESLYPIMVEIEQNLKLKYLNQIIPEKKSIASLFLKEIDERFKKQLKIDDVLSLYLIHVAKYSDVKFFRLLTCLFQLFRNHMN
jgi:hypothetical protein